MLNFRVFVLGLWGIISISSNAIADIGTRPIKINYNSSSSTKFFRCELELKTPELLKLESVNGDSCFFRTQPDHFPVAVSLFLPYSENDMNITKMLCTPEGELNNNEKSDVHELKDTFTQMGLGWPKNFSKIKGTRLGGYSVTREREEWDTETKLLLDNAVWVYIKIPRDYPLKDKLLKEFCTNLEHAELRCFVATGSSYSQLSPMNFIKVFFCVNSIGLLEKKEYNAVIQRCSAVIDLVNTCIGAYYYRGRAYTELQEYEKALQDYSRVVDLNPQTAFAYLRIMEIYLGMAKLDRFEYWNARLNAKVNENKLPIELQAVKLYLSCIYNTLKDKSSTSEEKRLDKLLTQKFDLEWNFDSIVKTLENRKISNRKMEYIKKLTDRMENRPQYYTGPTLY